MGKSGEKWGKVEQKYCFPQFFYFTVKNHKLCSHATKMKKGFPNVFKLVKPPLSVDLLFEFN